MSSWKLSAFAPKPLVQDALVSGTPEAMLTEVRAVAGDRDVYVDGGRLIQQLVDAGLIDEFIVTVIPVDLGDGIPLLAGADQWDRLSLEASRAFPSGVEQRRYVPAG